MRKVAWPAGEPSAYHRERWYAELTSERPQVRPLLRPQHPFDVQQYYGSRADATEHNARRVAQTRGMAGLRCRVDDHRRVTRPGAVMTYDPPLRICRHV